MKSIQKAQKYYSERKEEMEHRNNFNHTATQRRTKKTRDNHELKLLHMAQDSVLPLEDIQGHLDRLHSE